MVADSYQENLFYLIRKELIEEITIISTTLAKNVRFHFEIVWGSINKISKTGKVKDTFKNLHVNKNILNRHVS